MANPSLAFQNYLAASASLANAPVVTDTSLVQQRAGRRGEAMTLSLVPTKHVVADEGGYYTASNPAIGTPVTYALISAFTPTGAAFVIRNGDSPGGKSIYLDYLRLICGVVGAAATSVRIAAFVDSALHNPTASTAVLTSNNVSGNAPNASIATLNSFSGGSQTIATVSNNSARQVGQTTLNQHIPVAGDEYICYFGSVDPTPPSPGTAAAITISGKYTSALAPMIIGPQQYGVIFLWEPGVTTTAPTFEFELGWWER